MLKWQDELSAVELRQLRELREELTRLRPRGWSVVWSGNEIVVRPARRAAGKFSVTSLAGRQEYVDVAFFSRVANGWSRRRSFKRGERLAPAVMEWMIEAAEDPTATGERGRAEA